MVNRPDKYGYTPLHRATLDGHNEVIYVLLKCGSDPNLANEDQEMPLHIAVRQNNTDAVKLLLQFFAAPSALNRLGQSPLQLATNQKIKAMLQEAARASNSASPREVPAATIPASLSPRLRNSSTFPTAISPPSAAAATPFATGPPIPPRPASIVDRGLSPSNAELIFICSKSFLLFFFFGRTQTAVGHRPSRVVPPRPKHGCRARLVPGTGLQVAGGVQHDLVHPGLCRERDRWAVPPPAHGHRSRRPHRIGHGRPAAPEGPRDAVTFDVEPSVKKKKIIFSSHVEWTF